MNKEQQRIAIAEWAGWKWIRVQRSDGSSFTQICSPDSIASCLRVGKAIIIERPEDWIDEADNAPNYLSDLNAIREAEGGLTDEQRSVNAGNLEDVCGGNLYALYATAPQRCEALLRTLGKWDNSK